MRESAEHIFGEYRVSIEPTRSEEGQERRRCTICGAEEFRAIPRLEIPKSEKLFFFGVVAAVMAFITSVAIVIRKRL